MNAAAASPPKRILVVDDNEIILQTVSLKLQRAGYQPFTALDGVKAVAVAKQEPLDLILLDINFPPDDYGADWDGFRIMEWLHQLEQTRNTPIVIITSSRDEQDREQAQRLGAAAFFYKPLDHADLLKMIRETLELCPA